jgi:hypothetical protein
MRVAILETLRTGPCDLVWRNHSLKDDFGNGDSGSSIRRDCIE